jgi:Na+-translocating ferredoxin:NAD+ oxidoreductase RNF subunit RnfB
MIKIYKENCVSCGSCIEICESQALIPGDDEIPVYVAEKCKSCKLCSEECPAEAIEYISE